MGCEEALWHLAFFFWQRSTFHRCWLRCSVCCQQKWGHLDWIQLTNSKYAFYFHYEKVDWQIQHDGLIITIALWALGRRSQEDDEFEAILNCIVRSCFTKLNKQNTLRKECILESVGGAHWHSTWAVCRRPLVWSRKKEGCMNAWEWTSLELAPSLTSAWGRGDCGVFTKQTLVNISKEDALQVTILLKKRHIHACSTPREPRQKHQNHPKFPTVFTN